MIKLTADMTRPAQENFLGLGAVYHGFAGQPDDAERVYSKEQIELEYSRVRDMRLKVARTYINWYAWEPETGKWNWENERCEAFYNWCRALKEMGVDIAYVTLHVGLGTFRPVKVDNILEHHMHSEYYQVSKEAADKIHKAKSTGHRVIAVGTTSCRTLESATKEDGTIEECCDNTEIFIYPGYQFKMIDALITNFHLPESTLIMLVSALAGREHVLAAYEEAIKERYRFFSFGDAMIIS